MITIPAWTADALCAQVGGDYWYPEGQGGNSSVEYRMAKEICQQCPVINQCLQLALDNGEDEGVWGGLSPRERRRLRRAA